MHVCNNTIVYTRRIGPIFTCIIFFLNLSCHIVGGRFSFFLVGFFITACEDKPQEKRESIAKRKQRFRQFRFCHFTVEIRLEITVETDNTFSRNTIIISAVDTIGGNNNIRRLHSCFFFFRKSFFVYFYEGGGWGDWKRILSSISATIKRIRINYGVIQNNIETLFCNDKTFPKMFMGPKRWAPNTPHLFALITVCKSEFSFVFYNFFCILYSGRSS